MTDLACIPKSLPEHQRVEAARTAVEINPANAPRAKGLRALGIYQPDRIALLTSKYWGTKGVDLGVTFLDSPTAATKTKILAYANKWGRFGNIRFRESAAGQVRLARTPGQGYYSYLGTDILHIPAGQQTMNLESFAENTPDSEYDRVVCHEFGHTLGFPHEHERQEILNLLDVEKTVAWFKANVGWDRQTVMEQVFTPIDPASIQATAPDVRSIMTYQFVGACTKSGQPIPGGDVIDPTDGTFAGKIYPLAVQPPPPPPPPPGPTMQPIHIELTGGFKDWSGNHTINLVGTGTPAGAAFEAMRFPTIPPAELAFLSKYGFKLLMLLVQYGSKALPIIEADIAAGKSWAEIKADVIAALMAGQLAE